MKDKGLDPSLDFFSFKEFSEFLEYVQEKNLSTLDNLSENLGFPTEKIIAFLDILDSVQTFFLGDPVILASFDLYESQELYAECLESLSSLLKQNKDSDTPDISLISSIQATLKNFLSIKKEFEALVRPVYERESINALYSVIFKCIQDLDPVLSLRIKKELIERVKEFSSIAYPFKVTDKAVS